MKISKPIFLDKPLDEFLNQEDYNYYQNLKKTLSSHICRNCRNRRVESFSEILSAIRYFVDRSKEDAWKRSLVCGVCWYKNFICVNIRQMSEFLEKCKSSINGSLQRLCLVVLQDKEQSLKILTESIPFLKNHQELRKMWSVRQLIMQPQMFLHQSFTNQIVKQKFMKLKRKPRINQTSKTKKVQNIKIENQNNSLKIETKSDPPPPKIENNNNDNEKENMELFREINSLAEIFD